MAVLVVFAVLIQEGNVVDSEVVALRRGDYRDPLEVLIRQESRTCAGCVYGRMEFSIAYCDKRKQYGKRCESYREAENGAD